MKLPQWEKRLRQLENTVKPSAYSRFVIFTGAAVAAGLLAASWMLTYLAPFAESTWENVALNQLLQALPACWRLR